MEKKWDEIFRQKMEGHQKNPPKGLWEGIADRMDLAKEPVRKAYARRLWYGGVAAAVLALTGIFVFYQPQSDQQPILSDDTSQPLKVPVNDDSGHHSEEDAVLAQGKVATPYINMAPVRMSVAAKKVQPTADESMLPQKEEEMQDAETLQDESYVDDHSEQVKEEPSPSMYNHPDSESLPLYRSAAGNNRSYTPKKKDTDANGQWTVGLRASGALLAYSSSEHTEPVYSDALLPDAGNGTSNGGRGRPGYSGIRPYRITERVADHHLPIRVGVSLQYHLNDKTALLTGVNYTYLYSKFSVPLYKSGGTYEQKLRYIGVPLGLSQQIWRINQLRLYVSGSVLLEKCLNDNPWQWSVNGAVGAEYGIGQHAGIYFEPSVGYYFKDGTDLEHYYSEHPFAPAVEFGLRLHLDK